MGNVDFIKVLGKIFVLSYGTKSFQQYFSIEHNIFNIFQDINVYDWGIK